MKDFKSVEDLLILEFYTLYLSTMMRNVNYMDSTYVCSLMLKAKRGGINDVGLLELVLAYVFQNALLLFLE